MPLFAEIIQRYKSSGGIIMLSKKTILGITAILATTGAATAGYMFFNDSKEESSSVATTNKYTDDKEVKIDLANQPLAGDKNAAITIVEYSDYKCPACGYFSNAIYPQLTDYIERGIVNFVHKNYAFVGEDSPAASIFGEAVYALFGDEMFYKYNKTLMEKQNELYSSELSDEEVSKNKSGNIYTEKYLIEMMSEFLNDEQLAQLKGALENKEYIQAYEADMEEAQAVGVTGVPSVFLNGKAVSNAMDWSYLQAAIEAEVKIIQSEQEQQETQQ